MKHLVLVHSGATEYDKQGRIQGTLDVPLSADGRRQVQQLAEELQPLHPTALYTAPGQASRETSEILSERLALRSRTLDKLQNVDHGLWQGMLIEDVKKKQPKVFRKWLDDPESICPPEGETIGHARQRVAEALQKLLKKLKPEATALLVAPDPLVSVMRQVLTGTDLGDLWHATGEAGRWEQFDVGDREPSVVK